MLNVQDEIPGWRVSRSVDQLLYTTQDRDGQPGRAEDAVDFRVRPGAWSGRRRVRA